MSAPLVGLEFSHKCSIGPQIPCPSGGTLYSIVKDLEVGVASLLDGLCFNEVEEGVANTGALSSMVPAVHFPTFMVT